ncbi:hypothetical protein CSA56_02830 [candidate division KSB3 bacterium]|uniref:SH3b domain-containing protein n=1 Tax=candidate division KSB3 bacterium TaxID=2044937 RepID=A0A2G6KK77_9BACT|nr:MAG: hypothetical protein CSA56_02830 [candidate division KSB3 bacterium]
MSSRVGISIIKKHHVLESDELWRDGESTRNCSTNETLVLQTFTISDAAFLMKYFRHSLTIFLIGGLLLGAITACNLFKKKMPPNDMFSQAEQHRKNENLLEAIQLYDDLIKYHNESELVPHALYYSGYCKYTLSLRSPGQKAFEQRKEGLSELKQQLYTQWLDYMGDQKDTFSYVEAIDQYQYRGKEFKTLIEQYPSSNLVDDAAFQLVHLHIQAKQATHAFTMEQALQLYTEYFTDYPQSPYRSKGLDHLLRLIEEQSDSFFHHDTITASYLEFAKVAQDFPGCGGLAYQLAVIFLETDDRENAAALLGVPAVVGLGIVETARTRLNIRSGKGTNYRIAAKIDKGEQILLLDHSDGWYQVLLKDGTLGYAHGDFIREL